MRVERSADRRSYRSTSRVETDPAFHRDREFELRRVTDRHDRAHGMGAAVACRRGVSRVDTGRIVRAGVDGASSSGHEPALARARTVTSCAAALPMANTIGGPAQNFVCADATGNIGWTILGRIPVRGAGYDATHALRLDAARCGLDGMARPAGLPASPESGDRSDLEREQPCRRAGTSRRDRRRIAGPWRTSAAIRDDLFALAPAVRLNPTCLRSSSTSGRCFLRGGET